MPEEDLENTFRRFAVPDADSLQIRKDLASDTFQVMNDILDVRYHCLQAPNTQTTLSQCGKTAQPVKSRNEPRRKNAPISK